MQRCGYDGKLLLKDDNVMLCVLIASTFKTPSFALILYYSVFRIVLGIICDFSFLPKLHCLFIEQIGVAVTPLTAVRVVLGSNLGRDIGYPDTTWLCSGLLSKFRCVIRPQSLPSEPFQFVVYLSSYKSTLHSPATD
jgi:hypothetical protein